VKAKYKLIRGDCLEVMKKIPDGFVDLTVTSPPYDNLRSYNGNNEQWSESVWKGIIRGLYRVTAIGGVVVWVVNDATIKGSETGTSFKQALYFKECGFNLHDTMIYRPKVYQPLTHNRYEQEFQYMFCFSKGKPKTFNPIKIPCKYGGQEHWGKSSTYKDSSGKLTASKNNKIKSHKIKGNIFEYNVGSTQTGKIKHPAMFPLDLAKDQIISWSNENDIILDCFLGSGTTGVACMNTNRRFVGIELDETYFKIAKERISCESKDEG